MNEINYNTICIIIMIIMVIIIICGIYNILNNNIYTKKYIYDNTKDYIVHNTAKMIKTVLPDKVMNKIISEYKCDIIPTTKYIKPVNDESYDLEKNKLPISEFDHENGDYYTSFNVIDNYPYYPTKIITR